jgi:non-lysosomal glucosylceramidase
MASYPHGDLLDFPFPYYTEIMTGFEYSTASQMLYEGQTEDGLKIYEAIRNRFDGNKRNPFNEGEYGHRYGRAMASWTGVLAYTGFQYSAVSKSMSFNQKNGKYFWSNGYQYGTIAIEDAAGGKSVKITSMNGDLTLNNFALNGFGNIQFKTGRTMRKGEPATFNITNKNSRAGLAINAKVK